MIGLKTDDKNNLIINEQHSLKMIEGIDKTAQDIRNSLAFNRGEDPFNVATGINWDKDILGKATKENVEDIIAKRIEENPEVYRVKKIKILEPKDNKSDTMDITTEIDTIYGVLNV